MTDDFSGIVDLLARQPVSFTCLHQTTRLLVVVSDVAGLSQTLLEHCERAAMVLWNTGSVPNGTVSDLDLTGGSVLGTAIDHWSGDLATVWVQGASNRWNAEPGTWNGLPDGTRQALEAMLDEASPLHSAVVAVLARFFAFLTAADENWTTSVLLPSFDWADPTRASVAWDGYLLDGRWNERILTLLEPSLTGAFAKLEGSSRTALVWFMAGMTMRRAVVTPFDSSLLSSFLAAASPEEREKWAETVAWLLNRIDDSAEAETQWGAWILTYWHERLDNLPRPLSEEEVGKMLQWVPFGGSEFPAAVELLERSPALFTNVFLFFRRLKDHPVLTTHPVAVARLLAHVLEHCVGPVSVCAEIGAIIRALLDQDDEEVAPYLHKACEGAALVGCTEAVNWDDELRGRGW